MAKSTTKQQRKYSQDFSADPKIPERVSHVETSNQLAYNVNHIVAAYQANTGETLLAGNPDPAQFGDATALSYQDAMFHTAELDSAFALLPSQERSKHGNSVSQWLDSLEPPAPPPESTQDLSAEPAAPPPEDASEDNSEA